MKTLFFALAKLLAVTVPIILFVGGAFWFCDRLVGGSDPIMHPFIYTGPVALILGALTAWICYMIVSDQEARSRSKEKESVWGD